MAFTALPREGDRLLTIASLGCSIAGIAFSSMRTLKGHGTSLRGQLRIRSKEAPHSRGGMQVEASIDITEVEAPQARDAAQPISQRASMHVQGSSRSVVAAAAFQVVAQCVYQFVVLRGVLSAGLLGRLRKVARHIAARVAKLSTNLPIQSSGIRMTVGE